MSRYDRSSGGGGTRLYVGRLSRRVRSRDLEDAFGKYGRVRGVDMKYDFAFVDFSEHRDADDARHYLNGRELGGSRITVEFARGASRGGGGGGGGGGGSSREYLGRGPPPGTGRCYNCGHDGHWARDCKSGDWRNKCYKCGERGHIERDCRNSTRVSSRYDDREGSRSESRSRSRERDGEHRSGSYRKERSDSRSPPRRGGGGRSRSPSPRKGGADNRLSHRKASVSRSPVRRRADGTPPPKREDSRSPIKRAESGSSPRSGGSISPPRQRRRAASPLEPDVKRSSPSLSPRRSHSRSPIENGRSVSPSPPPPPRNMSRSRSQSRSPIRDGALSDDDDDTVDLPRSPNGIEQSPTRSDD